MIFWGFVAYIHAYVDTDIDVDVQRKHQGIYRADIMCIKRLPPDS